MSGRGRTFVVWTAILMAFTGAGVIHAQTRPADATSGVCADLTLADHLGRGPHFGGGFRAWRLRFGWFPSTKIRLLTDG